MQNKGRKEGKTPPPKKREQRIMKESNSREKTKKYETKLEQIVNAVKEGFQLQNDLLANTMKGTNQVEQKTPVNQTQRTILHQTQQTPTMQITPVNKASIAN